MATDREAYLYWHFRPQKGLIKQSNYPVISNVQATNIGLITWTTNIASTSQVQYGSTPMLGPISSFDGTLVTSHSVQLTGLNPSTLYYFRVQSFYLDSLSISDLYTFQMVGALLAEDGTFILDENGNKILLES